MKEQEHHRLVRSEAQVHVDGLVCFLSRLALAARLGMARQPGVTVALAFALSAGACVDGGNESGADGAATKGSDCIADLALELTIGDDAGAAAEYQFASISSIVVSASGTIWVVDGGGSAFGPENPLVRQYDSSGKYIRQVGRKGSGPGEYRNPYAIAMLRDGRVVLRDSGLPNRLTLYTPDGTVDKTWILDPPRYWVVGGVYPLQVDTGGIVWLPFWDPPRPGPNRQAFFLRMRPDGTVIDTVLPPPIPEVKREQIQITRTTRGGGTSTVGITIPNQPWGHRTWSPFGTFAIARGDEYRVEILSSPTPMSVKAPTPAKTTPSTIVTREIPAVPVSQAEQAAGRSRVSGEIASVGAGRVAIPDMATQKPPIRGIRFSEDGRLLVWVSMPSRNQDGAWIEPNAYDVFDPQGRFLCRLLFPESFYPHGMRGDLVWGVNRGEYDLETIRRYRIIWP